MYAVNLSLNRHEGALGDVFNAAVDLLARHILHAAISEMQLHAAEISPEGPLTLLLPSRTAKMAAVAKPCKQVKRGSSARPETSSCTTASRPGSSAQVDPAENNA